MIESKRLHKNTYGNFGKKNSNCVLAYGLQRKVNNIENVDLNEKIENYDIELIRKPIMLAMRNSMFNLVSF